MTKKLLFQAHRGVSTERPENTMSAFELAVEQNYAFIEMDPRFTKDGVCVLLHDGTVNRTGRRRDGQPIPEQTAITDLTMDQLEELEFGSWLSPEFAGEPICRLEDALTFAVRHGIRLKLDNVIEHHSEEQQNEIFGMIRAAHAEKIAGITGAHIDFLTRVHAELPTATLHYDGPVTEEVLKELRSLVGDADLYIWLRYDNERTAWNKNRPADAELSAVVRQYGHLGLWLLTEPCELRSAEDLEAEVIETDGSLKPAML